jgi:TPR repeat protein
VTRLALLLLPATLLAQGATQSISTGTFAGITARVPLEVAEDVARRTAAVKRDIARAKAGDLDAQYALGMRLIRGDDLVRKPAKGVLWLEDAAKAGEPRSQYRMGQILARGLFGRRRDRAAALAWFERAAAQGIRRAEAAARSLGRRRRRGVVPLPSK